MAGNFEAMQLANKMLKAANGFDLQTTAMAVGIVAAAVNAEQQKKFSEGRTQYVGGEPAVAGV